MYDKKDILVKFILIFSGVVAGIIVLGLIIGKQNAVVQNHSSVLPKESKNSIKEAPSNQLALKTSNLDRDQSRLSQKIKALELAISELKAKNQCSVTKSEVARGADQNYNPEPRKTPEMEEEETEAQIQAQLYMLQEKLQSEPVDAEWSDSAMIALYDSIQKSSKVLALLDADFRSTFCRVDLTFDTTNSVEDSLRALRDIIPWNSEVFINVDEKDSGIAVMYIAREDHSLPRLSEEDKIASRP